VTPAQPQSVVRQMLTTFCANSSGYLVAIVTGIVVARTLGPAGKGIATYAALIMALCTAAGSGLQSALMHECSRADGDRRAAYGASVRLLGMIFLPISLALIVVATASPAHAALAFTACAVPFAVYGQIANAVFLLNNDVRATVIQGAIPTFGVGVLTIPALTVFHGGLTAVLSIWAATFVCAGCYAMLRLSAHINPGDLRADGRTIRDEARFTLKGGLTSVVAFLNLRIDVFIVSTMLDARTLGIYTLAVATGELMWQMSRPIVMSTIGRIAAAERIRAIQITSVVTRHVLAFELALGAIVFVFAPALIHLVYGDGYVEAGFILRWLVAGQVLHAAYGPIAFFISVKEGRPMLLLAIQLTSAVLCGALSAWTIGAIGIAGPALATTITYACGALASAIAFAHLAGVPLARFTLLQGEDIVRLRAHYGRLLLSLSHPIRLSA
jgi:O-antigen/teichoic acid export membrane protein